GSITAIYSDWTPLDIGGRLGAQAVDLTSTASVAETAKPIALTSIKTLDITSAEKTSFTAGETTFISASVKSRTTASKGILVAVQVFDPSGVVLPPSFIRTTLDGGKEFTFIPGVLLPNDAAKGEWTAEVSVFTNFPAQGGVALAGPDTVDFTVT
ncbi:MAG: hypothetical protein ACE5PO_07440, partial [Candidatus Bathyarchaeia archaeon]